MIVDPNTGQPLPELGPDGSTIAAQGAIDMAGAAGITDQDMPLLYDVASSMPGATTAMAWNVNRVSNTLITGGRADNLAFGRRPMRRRSMIGTGGIFQQGIPQTFGPRHFTRLSTAGNIDPAAAPAIANRHGPVQRYSPFNILTTGANAAVRRAGQSRNATVRNWVDRNVTRASGQPFNPRVDQFSRGTFGRMAAMGRIQGMDASRIAQSSIAQGVGDLHPTAARQLARNNAINAGRMPGAVRPGAALGLQPFASAEAGLAAQRATHIGAIGATINGPISGRVAGYFAGAQGARIHAATGFEDAVTGLTRNYAPDSSFARGVRSGVAGFRGQGTTRMGQTAARMVGSRGMMAASRAAGPVGMILLARDLAMMTGKVAGTMANTAMDAGRSLVAPLNGGPLQGTFKDNSVAATSRQRGVMAIANSRLNARSVLGSEAASMAAHFG